ncbi:carbamoyltransferase C-terminal domain-containing protein [Marinibaculum pumilum]|uniref:Carbamoyltransferase C-terminal domain-containing protein n=1 Tax=Marinibaculum pumilum TaxID=1766165 RepID=A0ABV7L781_9PROT
MLILGIHSGNHDAGAVLADEYRILAAVAQERMTRRKTDGGRMPVEAIAECLAIAGVGLQDVDAVVLGRGAFLSRYFTHLRGGRAAEQAVRRLLGREKHKSMEREARRYACLDSLSMFDRDRFLADYGFRPDADLAFYNHHRSHAMATLFHTDWDDALLYTADGGGDNVQYSHRILRDGELATLYGGDEGLLLPPNVDSLGLVYGFATQALGFRINRHEGKLTGLAALGEPVLKDRLAAHFRVDGEGRIQSDFPDYPALRQFVLDWAQGQKREDVAASAQALLEEYILEAVGRLLRVSGSRRLGLSGGVFANVRLNQRLAEELPVDEVFVYPAMSDQGLAAGGVLIYLLERDGLAHWLTQRQRLQHLYLGRDYGAAIDTALSAAPGVVRQEGGPVAPTVAALQTGRAIAIYTRGMEHGPRALGARSILAAPGRAEINDSLNDRLGRSEFMPFAPVAKASDADHLFDLPPQSRYAARFMTITCAVKPDWRSRIPAVVHVDGTARPQLIHRDDNPLYHDIVDGYGAATGVKALVNTSFNAHEEPIIDSPAQCVRALLDDRIDGVVTETALWLRADKSG